MRPGNIQAAQSRVASKLRCVSISSLVSGRCAFRIARDDGLDTLKSDSSLSLVVRAANRSCPKAPTDQQSETRNEPRVTLRVKPTGRHWRDFTLNRARHEFGAPCPNDGRSLKES